MNVVSQRWQRLEALFEAALEIDTPKRAEWLAALEVDDDTRRELAGMLEADAGSQPESFTKRFGDAIASAAEVPVPGERIGVYKLLREIGSGGIGLVFLAERADDEFHREVAIKVIRGVATGDAVRQLRHERQILAGFDHPHIARLLDGGATPGGHPYLVMEFIRGAAITDACQRRHLPLRSRLALIAEVARAVHYAHQRLVVHRDIKPANVLLRDDGRPVLLDFGIAKLIDEKAQREKLATQPWFTPAYAAPEQRCGGTVSTATDIYALGLLLFELMTDERPIVDVDQRLLPPSRVAPEGRRATLRGDLDRIVALATMEEPGDRYPSADALARDVDRYLAGQPVRAAPDRAIYKLRKFVQRHPLGVLGAVVLAVVLTLFAVRLRIERDRALAAEARAELESRDATAVTRFLIGLFGQVEGGSRQRTLTPSELIDRGVQRLEDDRTIGASERARLYGSLGNVYASLGLSDKAAAAARSALAHAQEGSATTLELAEYHGVLGEALGTLGEYAEAEAAYREARALALEAGSTRTAAEALASQGLMLTRQEKLGAAEAMLRAALREQETVFGAEAAETAETAMYLTEALREAGRTDEARELIEVHLGAMRRKLASGDPILLRLEGYQANLLLQLGELDGAEHLFQKMLEHRSRLLESNSALLDTALNGLGTVAYQRGRTRAAADYFAQALAVGERSLGRDSPALAINLNNLASIYEEMGDYANAEPLMRRALAIAEQRADEGGKYLAQQRQNLGRLLMLAGRAEEAHDWLALKVPSSETSGDELQRARRLVHLAEWHRRYGDAREARRFVERAEAAAADLGGTSSARYAQVLKTGALLDAAAGRRDDAHTKLEAARALLVAGRGERYVGAGEIDLELAELARARGDTNEARRLAAQARAIMTETLVETAPQLARLVELETKLGVKAAS